MVRSWIRMPQISFELRTFEPNIKHLNVNSNHLKGIRNTQMHILAIEEILTIRMQIGEQNSKQSNANSNPSNEIRIIRTQILTIRKGFEAFEW